MKKIGKGWNRYIMAAAACLLLAVVLALSVAVSALVANTADPLPPFVPTLPTVAVPKVPSFAPDMIIRGRAFVKSYPELTTYTSVMKNEWTLGWSEKIAVPESVIQWDINALVVAVLTATEKTEAGGMVFDVEQAVSIHPSHTLPSKVRMKGTLNSAIVPGQTYLVWGFFDPDSWGEDVIDNMYAFYPDHSKEITVEMQDGGRQVYCNLNGKKHCPVYSELNMPLDEFLQTPTGQDWQKWILDGAYGTQNAMTVIGCEMLDGLLSFREGDAYLTAGEAFSETDHENGARVCLISRAVAEKNGLTVGMEIPLTLYQTSRFSYGSFSSGQGRTLYMPQYNFSESGTFLIVGIYDTVAAEEQINKDTPIPAGAVIVPLEALEGDYSADMPFELSFILPPSGADAFERELVSIGFGEYMSYSTPEPDPIPALQEILDGISARLQSVHRIVMPLTAVLTVGLLLLWVLTQKSWVERRYTAMTPRRTLFVAFLWRAAVLSAAAILPAWGLTVWSVPLLHTAVITRLGGESGAELLTYLPAGTLGISLWRYPVACALISAVLSCTVGALRTYHYRYRDEGEEEKC